MKVLAYYLPQFHEIKENNEWWGEGFTEWTNVAKAKKLYKNHYQPHIPKDLGFYDLRVEETRIKQAQYAQKYGISAFVYWHYWFGNGQQLLERPFQEVVKSGKPDFPFALAWANHSWYNKSWKNSTELNHAETKLLIEQKYLGEEDYKQHFYTFLAAFKDHRYYKIQNRLLFVIFDPYSFADFENFKITWNKLAQQEGLPPFYFVAHTYDPNQYIKIQNNYTYDAINIATHWEPFKHDYLTLRQRIQNRIKRILNIPVLNRIEYSKALQLMDTPIFEKAEIFPTLIPNWDNTPRAGVNGRIMDNCTPELWGQHIDSIYNRIKHKDEASQIVFLKSWNEWGEGNYLEPDLLYGSKHLEVLKTKLNLYKK